MGETILVTGAAGFIGSSLAERLFDEGHYVIGIDNFQTSDPRGRRMAHAEWIRHDVREPLSVRADKIYHLACPASPPAYQDDPVYTMETAFIGTLNVLRCAEECGARVLVASTSEVYGEPLEHPQREALRTHLDPMGPRSCYDLGKALGETLCAAFKDSLELRIARIFNTYGPGMDPEDGRVVSNFITQALAGDPLTVYGDGSQTRSFCYVADMVTALIKLMDGDIADGIPVNLGNPDERTVIQVARDVLEMTESSSEIEFEDLPKDDPTKRCPDIRLARTVLNWEPEVDWEVGLHATVEWFRKQEIPF